MADDEVYAVRLDDGELVPFHRLERPGPEAGQRDRQGPGYSMELSALPDGGYILAGALAVDADIGGGPRSSQIVREFALIGLRRFIAKPTHHLTRCIVDRYSLIV